MVDTASTGRDGLGLALADTGIEAVVLDVGLPDLDGLEVCRRIRRAGLATPVLMLTARDTVADRVDGLDAGADDYVVKPFAYPELSARLRALTRRGSSRDGEPALIRIGEIVLHERVREVTVADEPVELSRREFGLLEALLRHPDQVLSRDQLLDLAIVQRAVGFQPRGHQAVRIATYVATADGEHVVDVVRAEMAATRLQVRRQGVVQLGLGVQGRTHTTLAVVTVTGGAVGQIELVAA